MSDFLAFARVEPVLAVVMFCTLCWAVVAVIHIPFAYAFKAYNRTLRSRNIKLHGWPIPPVDADGGIVRPRKAP